MDLTGMMSKMGAMQEQFDRIQAELSTMRTVAESGGGMVKATANGHGEIISIKIEKEVIDPNEKEMLEDLVVAAVNRAILRSKEISEARMSEVARNLLPGMPNMPGMPFS